uniref:Zn(2)-C6 fungal-type domain-containing protein n=1 Tax=Fusarium oxysporum (strain Fo5176) TaxID=660025 RepID=A0A0D2YKE8_FUSOF
MFQSPTAFPQHQAMSGLAHSGLPLGTLPTGNRSQSMEGSKAPPDRTSPASNALEDPTTDEFGLASRNRVGGIDLGGKPKEDKADATPAWSGLKTKAGKERKRLPLACIPCRRKKIRCSGEKPACEHCLRSYIPCVYKITTRKAAPRTDYMAMLDKRPKCMEERVIKAIPKSDQEVASSVTRPVVKPAIPGTVPSSKPTKKRSAEEAFGPDLEACAKAPSEPKIEGDNGPSNLQVQEGEENKLQHEGTEALPSKDIQEHLADVFFDNIYGQSYHLLHKPSYMRKLNVRCSCSFYLKPPNRPMFIREDTIQIPLPVKEKYFQFGMPAPTEMLDGRVPHPPSPNDGQIADVRENMGVAAFLIRAIALWGRITTCLSQGCKDLDSNPLWEGKSHYMNHLNDAVNLEASLPLSLKYSAENLEVHKTENTPSQFLFMHICLQHNILLVSRAAMSARKQHGVHDDFFSEASKRTFNAANRISELLREAEQSGCFVSAPFAGYCAFSSTTVHILAIISRNPSMKLTAEANLTTNVKYLHKMKKYWGMFHWMVENVRTQYRNVLDAMRAGANVEERATQLSFLQYGDWFNRYPRGLSDAEFMDPATHKRKDSGADGVLDAKPELRSVEKYFTLPTPRRVENKDTIRAAAPKRKQSAKKQTGMPAQPGQHLDSLQSIDADAVSQEHKFSGGLGLQITGAAGFNPLAASNQQNPDFSTTMSPTSPANMTAFAHYAHTPTFFPPELLAMNFGQDSNGNIDPLDRQLIYGGYSMDASTGLGHGHTWSL